MAKKSKSSQVVFLHDMYLHRETGSRDDGGIDLGLTQKAGV